MKPRLGRGEEERLPFWSTYPMNWTKICANLVGSNVGSNVWAFSVGRKLDGICSNSVIFKMLHLIFKENNDVVCVQKTKGWCKL